MPIIFRPTAASMTCVACKARLEPEDATAAGHDAHQAQVFLCASHLGERYVPSWASVVANMPSQYAHGKLSTQHATRAAYRHIEELPTPDKRLIAEHFSVRIRLGRVVIIRPDEQPGYLSALGKYWRRHILRTRRQWAAMPPSRQRYALAGILDRMEAARFTIKLPEVRPDADVHVLASHELTAIPEDCTTLYIDAPSPSPESLLEQMPPGSLVVRRVKVDATPKVAFDRRRQKMGLYERQKDFLYDWK